MPCSLCNGPTEVYFQDKIRRYNKCLNCKGIMVSPDFYLSPCDEKQRYLAHNNDVENIGYQKFVSPIFKNILKSYTVASLGLDYGCGTGPVIASLLKEKGFKVNLYDPYFQNHPEVLELNYDYIICCEVIEHFQHPYMEFEKLFETLNPGGRLYCKTSLFSSKIDFSTWYYKNDPTHVFFYTEESLKWIKDTIPYNSLKINSEFIIFEK